MAEPAIRRGGEPVNVIAVMEDINEKLKLLNYEEDFLKKRSEFRPLTRTFFAVSSKPSEQFPYFSNLIVWGLKLIGADFLEWSEYEDPNSISHNILEALSKIGFQADFSATKLRHGSGDAVCLALDFLLDRCLRAKGFRVQQPIYQNSDFTEEAQVDEAAEIGDEVPEEELAEEEEMMPGLSGPNDNSDTLFDSNDTKDTSSSSSKDTSSSSSSTTSSSVDPVKWRLELERVGPMLKLRSTAGLLGGNSKEWRNHLEASAKHAESMRNDFPPAETSLKKTAETLRKAVERIQTKERHINKEFEHLGSEFKGKQTQLDQIQDRYNQLSASVAELTNELQRRTNQVEEIKSSMTERNNTMTDTTPLRKISNSLNTLKEEVKNMELRIGVVGQTLLQSKIRHQHFTQQQHHAHNTPGASLKAGLGASRSRQTNEDFD